MDYKLVHKCYEESRMRFYDSKYDHYVNLLDLDPRKDFEDVNVCIHDFDDCFLLLYILIIYTEYVFL